MSSWFLHDLLDVDDFFFSFFSEYLEDVVFLVPTTASILSFFSLEIFDVIDVYLTFSIASSTASATSDFLLEEIMMCSSSSLIIWKMYLFSSISLLQQLLQWLLWFLTSCCCLISFSMISWPLQLSLQFTRQFHPSLSLIRLSLNLLPLHLYLFLLCCSHYSIGLSSFLFSQFLFGWIFMFNTWQFSWFTCWCLWPNYSSLSFPQLLLRWFQQLRIIWVTSIILLLLISPLFVIQWYQFHVSAISSSLFSIRFFHCWCPLPTYSSLIYLLKNIIDCVLLFSLHYHLFIEVLFFDCSSLYVTLFSCCHFIFSLFDDDVSLLFYFFEFLSKCSFQFPFFLLSLFFILGFTCFFFLFFFPFGVSVFVLEDFSRIFT